jgi:hypothetical protein
MRKTNYRQGKFYIKNEGKYRGNSRNIIYRSSWEKRIMAFFDQSSNVEWWNSEGMIVPYLNPIDKKMHSYFPDFIFMNKSKQTYMIEVKPYRETLPPSKKLKNYRSAAITYIINQSKWKQAQTFCEKQNWKFIVWTENEMKKMGI